MTITKEMRDHFEKRTNTHIGLVQKWYKKLMIEYYSIPYIHIHNHDHSKFVEPEHTPYILLTWNYYCKDHNIPFEVSADTQEQINKATLQHITFNPHHPEYWDPKFNPKKFNPQNRDEPGKNMVDATRMPLKFVLEMLADWLAMSDEKGTDPREWAHKNVNIRWRFTPEQINLIESVLHMFYKPGEKDDEI